MLKPEALLIPAQRLRSISDTAGFPDRWVNWWPPPLHTGDLTCRTNNTLTFIYSTLVRCIFRWKVKPVISVTSSTKQNRKKLHSPSLASSGQMDCNSFWFCMKCVFCSLMCGGYRTYSARAGIFELLVLIIWKKMYRKLQLSDITCTGKPNTAIQPLKTHISVYE